jgi:hypothetical protein
MKTIISIELNDAQRDYLATLIDDKPTKRLATRGDIKQLVEQFMGKDPSFVRGWNQVKRGVK